MGPSTLVFFFLTMLLGNDCRRRDTRGRRGGTVVSPTSGRWPFHITDGRLHSCLVVDGRRWGESVCTPKSLPLLSSTNSRFYRIPSKCSAVRTSHSKIWFGRCRFIATTWTNRNRLMNPPSLERISCTISSSSLAVHDPSRVTQLCRITIECYLYLLSMRTNHPMTPSTRRS